MQHKQKERLNDLNVDIGDDNRLTEDQISQFETIDKHTTKIKLPGGTALVATNTLIGYIKSTGTNYKNMGRRSWMQLEGESGHRTRIVQAYAVGNNKSKQLGST